MTIPVSINRTTLSRLLVPLIVLAAGLTATGLAVLQLNTLVEEAEHQRFEMLLTDEIDAITDRLDTYSALLRGTAGLFAASDDVSREAFSAYFDRLRVSELYPGLQGMGFAAVVRPEERAAFLERMRAEGAPDFRIWPEGERDLVTSIAFLEPTDERNKRALGFDMYSEEVRRTAMARSRDTGRRTLSSQVTLVQEGPGGEEEHQPGFLIYVPVYGTPAGRIPDSAEERRATIEGWVYSPFRAGNLFAETMSLSKANPEMQVSIYDGAGTAEDDLLYISTPAPQTGPYEAERAIPFAGHQWTVGARRTDNFVPDSNRRIVPFVIAGGLGATLLLFAASLAQARATAQAEEAREQLAELNVSLEHRVEERTAQLESARSALETLNRNLESIVGTRTADLKAANEEIQRFAYIVSHDLRSPLVNVMGFTSELEVARDEILKFYGDVVTRMPDAASADVKLAIETELPEAISFIRSSTAKMDRLINAILRLSREGARVLTPEPIQLGKLLETTAQSLTHQLADAGAELVIDEVPELVSDRLALEQIFTNLLENAVKYLAPDRPGRIRVHGWTEGPTVFVDVEDNGRGIDPKDHGRVFDLFRRAGAQDRPGEGIGLAHVRALVRRLGGSITVQSAAGEGSTFRVSLPAVMTTQSEGTV